MNSLGKTETPILSHEMYFANVQSLQNMFKTKEMFIFLQRNLRNVMGF